MKKYQNCSVSAILCFVQCHSSSNKRWWDQQQWQGSQQKGTAVLSIWQCPLWGKAFWRRSGILQSGGWKNVGVNVDCEQGWWAKVMTRKGVRAYKWDGQRCKLSQATLFPFKNNRPLSRKILPLFPGPSHTWWMRLSTECSSSERQRMECDATDKFWSTPFVSWESYTSNTTHTWHKRTLHLLLLDESCVKPP